MDSAKLAIEACRPQVGQASIGEEVDVFDRMGAARVREVHYDANDIRVEVDFKDLGEIARTGKIRPRRDEKVVRRIRGLADVDDARPGHASNDRVKVENFTDEIAPDVVEITDMSNCGCGEKFEAIIVSTTFDGMGLLDRQRLVNEVIAEEMETIHAFTMKTWTPAQYEAKRSKG